MKKKYLKCKYTTKEIFAQIILVFFVKHHIIKDELLHFSNRKSINLINTRNKISYCSLLRDFSSNDVTNYKIYFIFILIPKNPLNRCTGA